MFYVVMREKKAWFTVSEEFESIEDAEYQVEAMKEADIINHEEYEYKIVEVEKVRRVI